MNIKKIKLNLVNNLISGISIIIFGLIVIIGNINIYTKTINLLVYIFIIYGLSNLVNFMLKKKIVRNRQVLMRIFLNIILGIIMIMFPKIPLSILPIIFSIYLLFNSLVKFIEYITHKENKLKMRFKELFFSIIFFILSMVFLFYPIERLDLFISIIGIYSLILGLNRILEFILDMLTDKYKLKIKRKIKITLPVFLEALMPRYYLNKLTNYIDYIISDKKNSSKEPDLEIFIHVSKYGFNQFGHIDIRFENKVYSYGNYDKRSQKLFTTIGDGVLFELSNKEKYINFCIESSKKTIVEYGLKLTDNQKNKLKSRINKIKKSTISWYPKDILNKKDYAYRLSKNIRTKFYKFKEGKYKNYFTLGVNCTYFIDDLLNETIEVLKLVGIISPGTYFDYLEDEFKKKNSKVISKIVYNKENIGDINDKNKK